MDLASLMNLVSVEENDWIQLLHGSHGQSGRKIKWIPKLHHMYVNGQTSSFQPPVMQFFSCIHSHGMPYDSCGIPVQEKYSLRDGYVLLIGGVPLGSDLKMELAGVLGMVSVNAIQIWFFADSLFIHFV